MSIKLYSLLSGETEKLKDKDIEISVNDEGNIDIIRNEDPDDYPTFSCLYNKAEVDERVVNDYIENGGKLDGFGNVPITHKFANYLKYVFKGPEKTPQLEGSLPEKAESYKELIKDELCVNTLNEFIEEESNTCEAIHEMYTELMCAADGYEQIAFDEQTGQSKAVHYLQYPKSIPTPTPDPYLAEVGYSNLEVSDKTKRDIAEAINR
ncbi:hypothetical protein, partial [Bacteroides acidifaciens]|uniref:hypothetical protein n=1 Tax=Bacteroides acidifaciens TaxID=85831 RepID=UPI0025A6826E